MTKASIKRVLIICLGVVAAAGLAIRDRSHESTPDRHVVNSNYSWAQSGIDTPDPKGRGMRGCFFENDAPVHARFCISEM